MSLLIANILPFFFYWLILFAICYIAVEYGQTYFYDEATPSAALKVTLGSAILAIILTITRPSYDKMITSNILGTVVLGLAAFLVFTFIFRFHPWHGAALGIGSVLLFSGLATMALESFQNRNPQASMLTKYPSKPLRQKAGGPPPPPRVEPPPEPEPK